MVRILKPHAVDTFIFYIAMNTFILFSSHTTGLLVQGAVTLIRPVVTGIKIFD